MSNTNIQAAYEATRKFNEIAGNLEDNSPERINFQLDLINEELVETAAATGHEGCDCGQEAAAPNAIELLDGACDLFVTVAGLMQKLEAAGFNVEEALKRVCDNNMAKFPLAVELPSTCPEGSDVSLSSCGKHIIYKRNSDGKVTKPTNFVSVDLEGLAPEGYFA